MSEFSAVLKRTIEGLGDSRPATRQKVYDKARQAIRAKLAAANSPMTGEIAQRQIKALEDAIETVEFDFRISDAVSIAAPQPTRPSPFATPRPAAPAQPAASPPPRPATPPPVFRPAAPPPAKAPTPAAPRYEPAPRPAPPQHSAPVPAPADEAFEPFEATTDDFDAPPAKPVLVRRRGGAAIALAAIAFFAVAGGGAAGWIYKDRIAALWTSNPAAGTAAAPAPEAEQPAAAPAAGGGSKFTQRMTEDGKEVDDGPADGAATVGEGTSVAAATQQAGAAPGSAADTAGEAPAAAGAPPADAPQPLPTGEEAVATPPVTVAPTAPATAAAPAAATVPVGQKAIFYEERTNSADGSANPGNVVWTLVMDSPGGDQPAEPAIRAEASVPERNLTVRMTIRRNGDKTLPASHIVELVMIGPENPASGAVDNVLRMTFKENEGATGSPLFGVPAKIADGFFLIALTDSKAEIDANLALMKREQWIDIPFVYGSGRRALITLEKGVPGEKVFEEAMKAWEAKASG